MCMVQSTSAPKRSESCTLSWTLRFLNFFVYWPLKLLRIELQHTCDTIASDSALALNNSSRYISFYLHTKQLTS